MSLALGRCSFFLVLRSCLKGGGLMGKDVGGMNEDYEEKLVNEEYKIWKKNTPFLYGENCDEQQSC